MTELLIRLVKNKGNIDAQRSSFARLSGITGIICNVLLSAVKFAVGALTGSVSVTADALNNLTDSAVNIVTLAGTRLSDKPVDREHPFGHGRMEYVSALITAISVFVVSFELAKSSIERIITPEAVKFSIVWLLLLASSVLVKLWMAYFNHRLYKLTGNINLKAVRQDSLNDCLATAATIVSLLLSHYFGLYRADGIIGLCVSVFIFWSGVSLLRQVVSPLLGEAPSKEITERIEQIICENDIVFGVHDLVIHSYGANKKLASADAEVDAKADIFTIHKVIDEAEKRIADELNINICIHTDPVDRADSKTEKYRLLTEGIVSNYNTAYSIHDFMLSEENGALHISFDLLIPFDEEQNTQQIKDAIAGKIAALCPEVTSDFNIEHSYV